MERLIAPVVLRKEPKSNCSVGELPQTPISLRTCKSTECATINGWNRCNFEHLLDIQQRTDEGCFFVSLYGMRAARFPQIPLPEAVDYYNSLYPEYSHVFKAGTLLVDNQKIESALEIYRNFNLKLTRATLNEEARNVFTTRKTNSRGEIIEITPHLTDSYFTSRQIEVIRHKKNQPLSPNSIQTPYLVLVHQAGGDVSHFMTIDGTAKSTEVANEYYRLNYRIIAIFEFEQSSNNFRRGT